MIQRPGAMTDCPFASSLEKHILGEPSFSADDCADEERVKIFSDQPNHEASTSSVRGVDAIRARLFQCFLVSDDASTIRQNR